MKVWDLVSDRSSHLRNDLFRTPMRFTQTSQKHLKLIILSGRCNISSVVSFQWNQIWFNECSLGLHEWRLHKERRVFFCHPIIFASKEDESNNCYGIGGINIKMHLCCQNKPSWAGIQKCSTEHRRQRGKLGVFTVVFQLNFWGRSQMLYLHISRICLLVLRGFVIKFGLNRNCRSLLKVMLGGSLTHLHTV